MTEPAFAAPASAGALLRAAREKQGLHIAALAASIKVAQRKLEALESDRLDELPDATFARALAQTVCRTLKIDARPVLELLPPARTVALEPSGGGLGAPFRDRPGRAEPGVDLSNVRPMVWAGALLVLAAVAVFFAPRGWWSPKPAETPAAEAAAASAAVAEAASAVLLPATVEPALPASAAGAAPASAAVAEALAPVVLPAATGSAASAASVLAGVVQLRSTAASWVEVRDARGQLLLSRTVQAGEAVGLDGTLPIRLTIGNAAATQLAFRGQAVDLVPRTRDNVARVELQ
jgi:cytoskeleton protein RodZ